MAVLLLLVVVVIAVTGECGTRTARAAGASVTPSTHLTLVVDDRANVSSPLLRAAIDEAGTIWAPYGVSVHHRAALSVDCPGNDVTDVLVTIVPAANPHLTVAAGSRTRDVPTPLGLTAFDEENRPIPSIVIFHTSIMRVATRVVRLGVPLMRWPSRAREEVVSRLLGRTLAHELGHFVLRLPAHSATGLMRAFHTLEELADDERSAFRLSPIDLTRLRDTRVAMSAAQ